MYRILQHFIFTNPFYVIIIYICSPPVDDDWFLYDGDAKEEKTASASKTSTTEASKSAKSASATTASVSVEDINILSTDETTPVVLGATPVAADESAYSSVDAEEERDETVATAVTAGVTAFVTTDVAVAGTSHTVDEATNTAVKGVMAGIAISMTNAPDWAKLDDEAFLAHVRKGINM